MRLCFLNTSSAWGGGEKWHFEMSEQLGLRKHQVSMIADEQSKLFEKARERGIEVHPFSIGRLSFLSLKKRLQYKKLIRKIRPDVMIINDSSEIKLCAPLNAAMGVKTIYRRGSAIPIRNTRMNRLLFRKFIDLVIANSEQTRKTILQNNPMLFQGKEIPLIYNGIDLGKYDKLKISSIRKKEGQKLILGNAGRFVPQKAQCYLVVLAEKLKERGLDFLIRIAGEGPLRKDVQEKVARAGLEEHFEFMGFVEDIKSFMHSLDVFVLTSVWEGFGYVLLEAMASARPIVAFDVSSNPELVRNAYNGFLVEKGDTEAMTARIMDLKDKGMAKSMGMHGRGIAEEQFELKIAVSKLDKLLNENFKKN